MKKTIYALCYIAIFFHNCTSPVNGMENNLETKEFSLTVPIGNNSIAMDTEVRIKPDISKTGIAHRNVGADAIWVDGTSLSSKKSRGDVGYYTDIKKDLIQKLQKKYEKVYQKLGLPIWIDLQEYLIACANALEGKYAKGKMFQEKVFDYKRLLNDLNPLFNEIINNVKDLKSKMLPGTQRWTEENQTAYQLFGFLTETNLRAQNRSKLTFGLKAAAEGFFTGKYNFFTDTKKPLQDMIKNTESSMRDLLLNPSPNKVADKQQRLTTYKGIMVLARPIVKKTYKELGNANEELLKEGKEALYTTKDLRKKLLEIYAQQYEINNTLDLNTPLDRHKLVCFLTSYIAGYENTFYHPQKKFFEGDQDGMAEFIKEYLSENNYSQNVIEAAERNLKTISQEISDNDDLSDLLFYSLSNTNETVTMTFSQNTLKTEYKLYDDRESYSELEKRSFKQDPKIISDFIKMGIFKDWKNKHSALKKYIADYLIKYGYKIDNYGFGGQLNEFGANRIAEKVRKTVENRAKHKNDEEPGIIAKTAGLIGLNTFLKPYDKVLENLINSKEQTLDIPNELLSTIADQCSPVRLIREQLDAEIPLEDEFKNFNLFWNYIFGSLPDSNGFTYTISNQNATITTKNNSSQTLSKEETINFFEKRLDEFKKTGSINVTKVSLNDWFKKLGADITVEELADIAKDLLDNKKGIVSQAFSIAKQLVDYPLQEPFGFYDQQSPMYNFSFKK